VSLCFFFREQGGCPFVSWAVKIEFGRVLDAQHDRMFKHAFLRARPMWREDVAPLDVVVAKKAVGRTGFAPAVAGIGDAGRRVCRKSFHQFSRSLVEATIAKVQLRKLVIRPVLRYLGQFRRPKSESKRDPAKVYKPPRQLTEYKQLSRLCRDLMPSCV
jgi:hypothetical protein